MNIKYKFNLVLVLLTTIIGCYINISTADQNQSGLYQVQWYEGLSISFSLKAPVEPKDVKDIGTLLGAEWYSEFTVHAGPKGERKAVVKSCLDYINIRGKGYTPLQSNAAGAFMNIAMKCSAIEELAKAKPATTSYLSDLVMDKTFPAKLPKQMAFMASTSEYNRIIDNPAIKSLTDVHKITQAEQKGDKAAIYKHAGGVQEITLVGKGDINNDGVLDVLLLVRNTVEGGSFASTHLYALTRKEEQGGLVLIKEFEY